MTTQRKFTAKTRRFIDEYLADPDMNAKAAAIRAGYSEKSASVRACQILADPAVKAEIEKEIKARSERTQVDKDFVINALVDVLKMSKGEIPIIHSKVGREGVETTNIRKTNLQAANKAAELLGRHLGMFTDKVETHDKPSLGETMAEISKRNAENRKSLLPKDNIDFDSIDKDDD